MQLGALEKRRIKSNRLNSCCAISNVNFKGFKIRFLKLFGFEYFLNFIPINVLTSSRKRLFLLREDIPFDKRLLLCQQTGSISLLDYNPYTGNGYTR